MNVRFFYIDRKTNINYICSECITHFKTFFMRGRGGNYGKFFCSETETVRLFFCIKSVDSSSRLNGHVVRRSHSC